MDDIDMEIVIYKYLLKRRDALDLNRMIFKEKDLKEKTRLEEELEKIEREINDDYYTILSTDESYNKLSDIEKEIKDIRSFELDVRYQKAIEERNQINFRKASLDLKTEFIEYDKAFRELKKYKISTVKKEELEKQLDREFSNYNADILYVDEGTTDVTVMEGIDEQGNKKVLYYYPYKDYTGEQSVMRQVRTFNKNGDIVSMTRGSMKIDKEGFSEYDDVDSASIVYQYDRDGNKKVGLYEDDITGVEYFEYDKEGNIKLSISDDHIMQYVKDGEKEYDICDGYFKPTDNGFTCLSYESMYDIESNEIKRMVFGNISKEEQSSIIDELDPKRQEEVIDILRIMEPIFEYASSYDSLDTEKREKVISWFKGFSKSLKIKDNKIHNKNEIAEGISPREGEIEEVLDETIVEQNRVNNQDKEKEGEAIGAN